MFNCNGKVKLKLKAELIVRIHYDIEGEFSDLEFTSTIRERALGSGLSGSVGVVYEKIEMILEGTPIAIGGFVTEIHRHVPRDSRIKRLVPKSKTVIESMNGKFDILEPELSVETAPIIDSEEGTSHETVRSGLLAGEIHRIVVDSMEHHAAHACDEDACARLAGISDTEIALLFSSMDVVFEHCAFNAEAVKRLVADPNTVVRLKLREETPLAKVVGAVADRGVSARIADAGTAATLFDPSPAVEEGGLAVLAIISAG